MGYSPVYRKKWGIFRNSAVQKEIRSLDPRNDHSRIIFLLIAYEFPWDMARALEIALYRTYASPAISELLDRSGEFRRAGQKRYDDTGVLIGEFMQNGYDSERGKRAIERMNSIHGHFNIRNEDYLFVLSTFVLDPIAWIEKFGWRTLTPSEKQALFYFFYEIGKRMHLKDIPSTLEDMERFSQDYQARYFHYQASNRAVAEATLRIVENWYPAIFRPLVKPFSKVFIDPAMQRAFAFKAPSKSLSRSLYFLMGIRKRIIRYLNLEKSPTLLENSVNRTYPKGYRIEEIGPDRLSKI